MIEKDKYDALMDIAEKSERTALYAVYSDGTIYFFNLSRLTKEGVDFGWHVRKCKKTTDFSNNNYVDKEVGLIQWHYARIVLPTGTI